MKNLMILSLLFATHLCAVPVNYSYDAAGRLITIDYGAGGSINYTYDAAGNITSRTVQPGMSGSAITGGKLTADGSAILLTGTNLVPADVSALQVSIDGKPARVIATCSASARKACQSDQLKIQVPPGVSQGRILVNNGRNEASYRMTLPR